MIQNMIETTEVTTAAETVGTAEAIATTAEAIIGTAEAATGTAEAAATTAEAITTTAEAATTTAEAITTTAEAATTTAEAITGTAKAITGTAEAAATAAEAAAGTAEAATTTPEATQTADKQANAPTAPLAYPKAYLIDSENISDEWVDLLDVMEMQDAIFVFYTGKSTHINCERTHKLMQHGVGRVHWIKCFEGNNALDFQLVTELGAMIGKGRAAEYIIISRDNGYNPVVEYWNDRGIAVSRKEPKACKKSQQPWDAIHQKHTETTEKAAPTAKVSPHQSFLHELLKSVDIMDNTLLYAVLNAFEGQAAGAEDYRQLRDLDEEEKTALRGLLLEDGYERGMNYLRLLARGDHWHADDMKGLYDIILKSPRKNKNQYRKALVERYGTELGESYYSMTKSHYNYVKKVKETVYPQDDFDFLDMDIFE